MMPLDKSNGVQCKLVLIRHEHTDLAGTFCGHLDPPLSANGRARLKSLEEELRRYSFTGVYSSDLERAQQTAGAIAARYGLPVRLRPNLRELAFGDWEGLTWKQIFACDPQFAQRWLDEYPSLAAPGGEPFERFLSRVGQAISQIADEVQGGCAAVVTHAGVIRTILSSVTLASARPFDLSSCSHGSWWDIDRLNRRWVLQACSSDLHAALSEEPTTATEVGCTT